MEKIVFLAVRMDGGQDILDKDSFMYRKQDSDFSYM
jgi:hypothetical protein